MPAPDAPPSVPPSRACDDRPTWGLVLLIAALAPGLGYLVGVAGRAWEVTELPAEADALRVGGGR